MPNSTLMTWPAISDLIPVVVFVGIAACIYMIAGFGFALFAVPSISLFMPVTEAVSLLTLLGLTSVLRQSFALRDHIDRPSAIRFSLWAVAGMPVGYWIVNVISDQALRIFLGEHHHCDCCVAPPFREPLFTPCRREFICVCVWCS